MEIFPALLVICVGNSPVPEASDAEFDVFFDLRLNKRLSKQSWGWWFDVSVMDKACVISSVGCVDLTWTWNLRVYIHVIRFAL